MKSAKQLILDEQRRQQAADDRLRCFAINNFGAGAHAYADSMNLQNFTAHYVRQCLRKCAASDKVTPEARERAKQLAELPEQEQPSKYDKSPEELMHEMDSQ